MSEDRSSPTGGGWGTLLYLIPPATILALVAIYRISPSFYTSHVLAREIREQQAVEALTFSCALAAAALLAWTAWRWWRRDESRVGSVLIAIVAAAAFFFAGEEISWGQHYFGWKAPAPIRAHSSETNLHNLPGVPIQSLGSLFLIVYFFGLPLAWRFRDRTGVPAHWRPAVPEGAVVWCVAAAFLWKEYKRLYRQIINPEWESSQFYRDFVEQLPEHKELLVSIALALYALLRLRSARPLSPQPQP